MDGLDAAGLTCSLPFHPGLQSMLRVATKRVVQQIARRQCVPAALAARTSVMLGTGKGSCSEYAQGGRVAHWASCVYHVRDFSALHGLYRGYA